MCGLTSRSKHFITIGVSVMERLSFRQDTIDFLVIGIIVDILKHLGTMA